MGGKRTRKPLTSPAGGAFVRGDRRDAQLVVCRKLVAVEDFGPGVAVTSHDGRAAPLDGLTQAAAGVDEPGEGGGMGWDGSSSRTAQLREQTTKGWFLVVSWEFYYPPTPS